MASDSLRHTLTQLVIQNESNFEDVNELTPQEAEELAGGSSELKESILLPSDHNGGCPTPPNKSCNPL